MTPVEFRYYQCLLNPTTGDRVTVALVHWDGLKLRYACSPRVLPQMPAEQRRLVERALRALEERVQLVSEQPPRSGAPLQEVFRVREGTGSLLFWAELRGALAPDPDKHFHELCSLLRFSPAPSRAVRLSTRQLFREMKQLGEALAREAPDRVKASTRVGSPHQHHSPISWKNGRWHHTIPLSFVGLRGEKEIHEATEAIMGHVQATIPPGEVPVVLAVLPEEAHLANVCQQDATLLREFLKGWQPVVLAEPAKGQAYLTRLEQTVRKDIASS